MTIGECIDAAMENGMLNVAALQAHLMAREDNALDHLRLAATQFGLPYVEIVEEVLAQTGLGIPLSTEDRERIAEAFNECIARIRSGNTD